MGRQHGALLKEEARQGPVPYFRRFVEKMMGGKGMGKVAWLALQRGIGVNVERALPSFAVETVRGMAEGAGMDFRDLMSGCTMPDTLMWIVARMMHVRRVGPAVAHRHALGGVTAMNEAGLTLTVHQHMFRPEDGSLWVGSGDTPTSHGTFVPFSLRKEDHAPELGTFTGGQSDAAYDHYRKAYLAYVDEGDAHVALAEMDRARELAPEQPVYHAIFGLLAMSLGDAKAAEPAFENAIALGHPDPERLASMYLWRGRAHDLEGRRAEALGEYERALALRADPPVRKAAEKGARKPYRGSNLHVEMTFGDVVSP